MSQVFDWETVAAGRVPHSSEIVQASHLLRNHLGRLAVGPDSDIASASIHGSANRAPTPRSDIDVFVVTRRPITASLGRIGAVVGAIHDEFPHRALEINADVLSIKGIRHCTHSIPSPRMRYLLQNQSLSVGANLSDMEIPETDRRLLLAGSIRSVFDRRWAMASYMLMAGISTGHHRTLFKLPDAVARWVSEIAEPTIDIVDKEKVTAVAIDALGSKYPQAAEGIKRLRHTEQAYTALVCAAVNGEVDRSTYDGFLLKTKDEACEATIWLPAVADWLQDQAG
jgi:predicted nucleotidyltransferase